MALTVDDKGDMEVVLRVKDEGSAVVQKFAETSEQSMQRAAGAAREATEQVGEVTKKITDDAGVNWEGVGKRIGGIAVAVGTVATAIVTGGMKMGDTLDKQAERLSVTAEWLSKIRFAAGLVDSEDKLGTWVRNMSNNLARAAESGKGVTGVLEQIGLDAVKLKEMGPEKAFESITAALEGIKDPMERTRVQMAIFGKGADDVHKMAGAMREAGNDAAQMGRIMSGEAASASNKFFDQIYRFNQLLLGIPTTVANSLAPAFAEMARIFTDFVKDSGAIKKFAEGLVVLLAGLGSVVVTVGTAFGLTGKTIGGFAAVLGALLRGEFREAGRIAKETLSDLTDSVEKFTDLQKRLLGIGRDGGMQKMRFTPGGGAANDSVWSDVLPGAELKRSIDDEAAQMDDHHLAMITRRRDFHFELLQTDKEAAEARQAIVDRSLKGEANAMASMFGYVAGLMQSKSRTLFEIGKGAAIAEAIVSTYQAVANALAVKPFWLGLALSGVALAKGLAAVASIRATRIGSSAATPVFSASPNTGLPVSPVAANDSTIGNPPQAQPRFTRSETVTLVGEFYSQEWMREKMIPMINKAQRDGVFIEFHTAAA